MKKKITKSDTKEKILKAGGLLFSQQGYFVVSMQDVADKVGITKAALYYHFESKNDLCKTLIEDSFSDLFDDLSGAVHKGKTPTDKLFNALVGYLNFSIKRPEVNLIFEENLGEMDELEKFIKDLRLQILNYFKKAVGKAVSQADKPFAHLSLTASLIASVLSKPIFLVHTTPKRLAKNIIDLFLPGEAKITSYQ